MMKTGIKNRQPSRRAFHARCPGEPAPLAIGDRPFPNSSGGLPTRRYATGFAFGFDLRFVPSSPAEISEGGYRIEWQRLGEGGSGFGDAKSQAVVCRTTQPQPSHGKASGSAVDFLGRRGVN